MTASSPASSTRKEVHPKGQRHPGQAGASRIPDLLLLWNRLTWRSKSMAFVLLVVAMVYTMIAVFLYTSVRSDLTSQVQTELSHLTGNIARNAADPLLLKEGGRLSGLTRTSNPLVRSVNIVDRQDIIVASTRLSRLGTRYTPEDRQEFLPVDLYSRPIRAGGQTLGAVWLQAEQKQIDHLVSHRLEHTISRLVVLGVVTAVIGLVGAYLVSLAITRPVSRLMREIEGMEQRLGLEDHPIETTRDSSSQDELHRLEIAFRLTEKRLEEHLQELQQMHQRQQAMQCMATIGEMSAQVAHEIRNALSSLRGAARYLVHYNDLENRQDFLAIIEEEVQRLYDMTQGFLDFGRSYETRMSNLRLLEVLARSVDRHRADFEAKSISVEIHCPSILHATLDSSLIGQALSNLLLNACDAVPARGGRIVVSASARENGQIDLSISDNGPGVPDARRSTIFKPYVTTKTKGSGLGLAVVAKIMMVHEGSVELQTADIGGAQFILHIPPRPSLTAAAS